MVDWDGIRREVTAAHQRLDGQLATTELRAVEGHNTVLLKFENEQTSGSFKFRGAINKALAAAARGTRILCTASTGNHALAVAEASARVGLGCRTLLPSIPAPGPIADELHGIGAQVEIVAGDVLLAERTARTAGESEPGAEYVSPYNDIEVIAGHSTLGSELVLELGAESEFTVVCSTGGGGLAAGLALGIGHSQGVGAVHAVSPAASPVLSRAVTRGHIIEEEVEPTICYGTAGNIDLDSITLGLCTALVGSWSEVNEPTIVAALDHFRGKHGLTIDGSAATAIAGAEQLTTAPSTQSPVVAIVCGTDRGQ